MGHAVADKLMYFHEALQLKDKLHSATYTQNVEKWDTDSPTRTSPTTRKNSLRTRAVSRKAPAEAESPTGARAWLGGTRVGQISGLQRGWGGGIPIHIWH